MTTHHLDEPSDAEYLARARAGDDDAFAALFARHRDDALRGATRLTTPDRADDLVAEAFARIYVLLRDGRGPTVTFRGYLMAAVRSVHVDHVRQDSRHAWMGDLSVLGELLSVDDGSEGRFRAATIGRAFRSLPDRWQAVLWFTAIEGMSLSEVGDLLGMTAHAVSQLSFRAREGLRQQYLAEHLNEIESHSCARIVDLLPGYVRGGLTGVRSTKVANHLAGCLRCSAAAAEIAAINKDLAVLLLPLAVGTGAGRVATDPGRSGLLSTRVLLAGAVLGTAVAVGAVLAWWPAGQSHPSAPTRSLSRLVRHDVRPPPRPSSLESVARVRIRVRPVAEVPRASTPSAAPTPLLFYTAPEVRPSPLVEDLVLGPATAESVDPARPRVRHVLFQVVRAVPGARTVLTISPAVERFEVHAEHEYGHWECVPRTSTPARSVLDCRLREPAPGVLVTARDLGLDLWTAGPGTATLRISLPGVPDPAPGDNEATVRLDP